MRRRFRSLSIRRQLTVVILAVSLVPLFTLFFANRHYIQDRMLMQTRETFGSSLTQAGSFLSDKAEQARNLMQVLFADNHIQQGYDFFRHVISNDETSWLADLSSGRVTYKGSLLGVLNRVYYYAGNDGLAFRKDKLYASMNEAQKAEFDAWFSGKGPNYLFVTSPLLRSGSGPEYLSLLARVPSATRLRSTIGLMQAEISTSGLMEILHAVVTTEHSALFLTGADGAAFLESGSGGLAASELQEFSAHLAAQENGADVLASVRFQGTQYLAGCVPVAGTDWQLILAVPMRDLTSITRSADRILVITILLLLLVILPVTALIARNILKPINRLRDGVNAVSNGDYSMEVPRSGTPELDEVTDSFNFMSKQTRRMLDEQYRMGLDLKNKELQLLQEQINPHFLYNTIDLMHWEARRAGSPEMEEITHALSQFYKLSLGHGEEIVTLGHEVNHVRAYMQIQNIRFMNRIRLITDVPDALLNVRIVKMILQPLVENSIQHGIREKPDESGVITVRAWREDESVLISVSDDGVGMDEETIARILTSEQPGYGVYNVNDRLILRYGSSAGLVFRSSPGEGTTVTMRIPAE